MKRILILGSTGMLGHPVADSCLKSGLRVTALVRNPQTAKDLSQKGVDVIQGDILDVDNIRDALADCSFVHISVGGEHDLLSVQNTISAMTSTKIERVSYVSGSTVAEQHTWFPMIDQKYRAELAIKSCGFPYTIFRPTWPMEQLPRFVRDGRATVIGNLKTPYHWFAVADFGQMVAKAFLTPEAKNREFYVHGPEAITAKDALAKYILRAHPEIKTASEMPIWLAKIIAMLTRSNILKEVSQLMAYFEKAGELGDSKSADSILGPLSTSLDEWIELQETGISSKHGA